MRIINDFNLREQAESLGISIWKTPSFLFIVVGLINIFAMTATFIVSRSYDEPEVIVVAEGLVVSIIFLIGNFIIRQIEEMAKLNKLKSEFVSVASHQLRTPLAAIRWETELLLSKLDKGLSEKQCKSINTVNILATRMTRLVNDLLDVTKIDQGRMILRKERVDVAETVDEVVDILLPLVKAKKMNIVVKKKNKILSALSDQEKIKLVIENLISNSIKYTKSRGKIEISLSKNAGFVVFSIRDNGVGIPKSQQRHIFSKFFRSDNIVKYQTEGTGLGLYIAKSIVEQSGGRVWFQSREDVGSVFNFSLPVA
jgi:signal transduction histidine kinase